MAKKVNAREVAALASVVVAGVEAADKVLEKVNNDGRLGQAAAGVGRKVVDVARIKGPLDRVAAQLALVEEAATALAASGGDDDVEIAADWSRQAQVLSGKIPLIRVLSGKDRKAKTADLQARSAALLDRVVRHGLDDAPVAPVKPRRRMLGRG